MNKVTFYYMIEKILNAIYTNTFNEEKLVKIIEEGSKKRGCWDIVYEETNFLNNLLKNYPWYVIPSLIKCFNSIMLDNDNKKRATSTKLTCNLIFSTLVELDFKIKERIKTIVCINISKCLFFYYKSARTIEFERLVDIMKKNFEFTEDLTSAEIAESQQYQYSQITLFDEETRTKETKSEDELREKISKTNTEKKTSWFENTKKAMQDTLDQETLEYFTSTILKTLEKIKDTQKVKDFYTIAFEVIYDLHKSTSRAWKKQKRTKKDTPLLSLMKK